MIHITEQEFHRVVCNAQDTCERVYILANGWAVYEFFDNSKLAVRRRTMELRFIPVRYTSREYGFLAL